MIVIFHTFSQFQSKFEDIWTPFQNNHKLASLERILEKEMHILQASLDIIPTVKAPLFKVVQKTSLYLNV